MSETADDATGTDPLQAWARIEAGFGFGPRTATVASARQARYHACCDVDSSAFGDLADVSILAQDTAIATREAGLPLDGRIHLVQEVRQHAPVRLGESLRLEGRVEPFQAAPRGRLLSCAFAFRRADGSLAVELRGRYLLPDGEAPARRRSPSSPPPDPRAGFTAAGRLRLTPEKVTGFSREVGNLIHFDPPFAAARGYRAPLAQGLMQVTALMGLVCAEGPPRAFALTARFLRPLFWDDEVQLLRDAAGRRFRCLGPGDRLAGEAELDQVRR